MKPSAMFEINSLDWHVARCAEGSCDRERLHGEMRTELIERCLIDNCPIGQSNTEQEVLIHVLGDSCPRRPRRM